MSFFSDDLMSKLNDNFKMKKNKTRGLLEIGMGACDVAKHFDVGMTDQVFARGKHVP